MGSKVLRDALICDDEEKEEENKDRYMGNEKTQVEKSIQFLSATQQVFLVSNQIASLNRSNARQCKIKSNLSVKRSLFSGTEQNKGSVFDLFDLIKNTKAQIPNKRETNNSVSRIKSKDINLNEVSFTDPNDILSYEVGPKEYNNQVAVMNVIVSNASTFTGLIANPIKVHMGYFANPDVSKLLRCGRGLAKTSACN